MLPSGIATLHRLVLAQPALEVCCVQEFVKLSSPKYHAHPVGLPGRRISKCYGKRTGA